MRTLANFVGGLMIYVGLLLLLRADRMDHFDNETIRSEFYKTNRLVGHDGGDMSTEVLKAISTKLGPSRYQSSFTWFAKHAQPGSFINKDNHVIQMYYIPSQQERTKVAVVMSSGWGESILKYTHYIEMMANSGAAVYAYELRGQAFSSKTGWDNGRVTHVDSFSDYTADLHQFVEEQVYPQVSEVVPIVYMGNSLGGLIGYEAMRTAERNEQLNRNLFDGMILTVPCVQPRATGTKEGIFLQLLHYIIPHRFRNFLFVRVGKGLTPTPTTHDEQFRLGFWLTLRSLAPQNLIMAGPSLSWLLEVYRAGLRVLSTATTKADNADILVLTASDDALCSVDHMHAFFRHITADGGSDPDVTYAPLEARDEKEQGVRAMVHDSFKGKNGAMRRHVAYENARHELLVEAAPVRDSVMTEINRFLFDRQQYYPTMRSSF